VTRTIFSTLASVLTTELGLLSATANPLTSGVLLLGEGLQLAKLAEVGRKKGLFHLGEDAARNPSARHKSLPELALIPLKKVDDALGGLTGGFLDLKGLAFAGFLGTGVYQLAKGRFTLPAWYTAFWYALGLAAMYKLTAAAEHRDD